MKNQGIQIDEQQSPQINSADIRKKTDERKNSAIDLWATVDKSNLEQDAHIVPLDVLYQRFHTNPRDGLSTAAVIDAQVQYGPNQITPPKPPSYLWLLVKEMFIGFNIILWIAGILTFLAYKPFGEPNPSITNLALGVILFLVITCNSLLNVYQQIKSAKTVASFSKLVPTIATVRRDGKEQQILTEHIVPGDIILVHTGDKISADCRFLTLDELKINTSQLTGESKPVVATVWCTSENFMDSTNIGFYSSMVEQGTGEALVIATGDNTVLGKMSQLSRDNSGSDVTGLHREVNRFVLFIFVATVISIIILWITWAAWLNRDHHEFIAYNANIVNSIGMAVGFLPLGLPSAVTLGTATCDTQGRTYVTANRDWYWLGYHSVLTFVAKKMYRERVIVKSLQIVETFNSVSVIATDKTGMLTQNKMTVTHLLWDTHGIYKAHPGDLEPIPSETLLQTFRRVSSGVLSAARRLSTEVVQLREHFLAA